MNHLSKIRRRRRKNAGRIVIEREKKKKEILELFAIAISNRINKRLI